MTAAEKSRTTNTFREWHGDPPGMSADNRAYLSFLQGLRTFTYGSLGAAFTPVASALLSDQADELQNEDVNALNELLDALPLAQFRSRLARSTQQMKYARIVDAFEDGVPELAQSPDAGPATLHGDDQPTLPDYFTAADIHLQPGGYAGNELCGPVYHTSTRVFYLGLDDDDLLHRQIVKGVAGHVGEVRHALDLACGIGQIGTELKDHYPDATVDAVDLSLAMLEYAQKRASAKGSEVHFRLANAAELPYKDDSYDLVVAYLLFHEVPVTLGRQIVREVRRVLKPGGTFAIVDFASRPPDGPLDIQDYGRDFDTVFNNEPFASDFVYSEFDSYLAEVFDSVEEAPAKDLGIPLTGSARLCRVLS